MAASRTAPPLDLVWKRLAPLRAYSVPPVAPPVKLDANESPFPLPAEAQERLARALSSVELHRYPDPRATALREALCARLGGHPGELVLGSGSDEVIALLMTALGRPPAGAPQATVLFPEPTFVMFGITARVHGLSPVAVPLGPRWELDVEAMCEAITRSRPNLVFLASPNNPTGNAFDEGAVRAVVAAAEGSLVVVDEAYGAFSGKTLRGLRERYAHVAVLGTLSKIGLAAARVGWIQMHPDLVREVDKVRQPFNLNGLSQAAAVLALTDLWPMVEDQVRQVVEGRSQLEAALDALPGLSVWPSDANFLLIRVDGARAAAWAAALRQAGIAVRHFGEGAGRLAGHIRVTVGTPEENRRLVEELASLARQ
jgi:histidinol-phosphate aminotransferase